mmetsp:Transcript_37092/g.118926  ORF Transcript_37092/g.118926 Transcript_37092/m.118926 type:complete len:235 (+) Transcript_37092:3497-4201(+)
MTMRVCCSSALDDWRFSSRGTRRPTDLALRPAGKVSSSRSSTLIPWKNTLPLASMGNLVNPADAAPDRPLFLEEEEEGPSLRREEEDEEPPEEDDDESSRGDRVCSGWIVAYQPSSGGLVGRPLASTSSSSTSRSPKFSTVFFPLLSPPTLRRSVGSGAQILTLIDDVASSPRCRAVRSYSKGSASSRTSKSRLYSCRRWSKATNDDLHLRGAPSTTTSVTRRGRGWDDDDVPL